MVHFTKESLELLRQRIDLVEVLSGHVPLQRAGAAFKGLCPFHEERTPSFIVQRGDTHYHCFGCGAHGDAITFLMSYVKMGFADAVESLAERFQVTLETEENPSAQKGPSKPKLKAALDHSASLYHYLLLHAEEGREALQYLYDRGIGLDFITTFQIGFAPSDPHLLSRYLKELEIDEEVMEAAGLTSVSQYGKRRDFFSDRILFPIRDPLGAVIGFSGRKFKEETFGGKYINTPETILFKKSRVLFGLSYGRARIAKERQAIIVEGQVDALRLIYSGFDYTVAGQGTAFGAEHAKELIQLGVAKVYLALDGDFAGQEAAVKIGHLFQQKGVEVGVVPLPEGSDPDAFLKEKGKEGFAELLANAVDYLSFLFSHLSKGKNLHSPSQKNEVITEIVRKIKEWEQPVMVHESLKKLSEIAQVPESTIGVGQISLPDLFIKKSGSLTFHEIDPHRILEGDLIRWLLFADQTCPALYPLAKANLMEKHFRISGALKLFQAYLLAKGEGSACDLLALGSCLDKEEEKLLSEIMQRKCNLQKAEEGFKETIRKILIREWMEERERIRQKIHSGSVSEEEVIALAKEFDTLKKRVPEVVIN